MNLRKRIKPEASEFIINRTIKDGDVFMNTLLEVAGLIVSFLGSLLLLKEPIRLALKDEHLAVEDIDMKTYNDRLRIRKVAIILLAIGFVVQMVAII